jgi:hypothetical protein
MPLPCPMFLMKVAGEDIEGPRFRDTTPPRVHVVLAERRQEQEDFHPGILGKGRP